MKKYNVRVFYDPLGDGLAITVQVIAEDADDAMRQTKDLLSGNMIGAYSIHVDPIASPFGAGAGTTHLAG